MEHQPQSFLFTPTLASKIEKWFIRRMTHLFSFFFFNRETDIECEQSMQSEENNFLIVTLRLNLRVCLRSWEVNNTNHYNRNKLKGKNKELKGKKGVVHVKEAVEDEIILFVC